MRVALLADPRRAVYGFFTVLCAVTVIAHPRIAPAADAFILNEQKIAPAVLTRMLASPLQPIPIILELYPPSAPFSGSPDVVSLVRANQALGILAANGHAFGGLPIIDGAAGSATAVQIQAMSLLPQVAFIHEDATVGPRRPSTLRARPPSPTSSLYTREVRADQAWGRGLNGRGIAVAVLDSGVAPDPDLTAAGNRVVASVSFANARNPAQPDDGGHGTHIAGTIAGDGTRSARQYVGIAPGANIVDVKVLDAEGRGRVSSVLAGLQWVLVNKDRFNIRVVNLSLGARPLSPSYQTDPMAAAVEFMWRAGVVVVAASGNTGPDGGGVESPGIDPYVITVGSTDDLVTLPVGDDVLGWFSGWGTPALSTAKPDLVAPGRQVIAPRVVGSALDQLLPDHVVTASNGSTYFRLTGTSMATAVVSGAVAVLLQQRPGLTPDQVKQQLVSNTQRFGSGGSLPPGAGAGLLDVFRVTGTLSNSVANRGLRPADPIARALYPTLYGQPLVWKDPMYLGQNWSVLTWATLQWAAPAWDNLAWDNIAWDNVAWDNIAWDNIAWDNLAWDNIAWDNVAWDNIAWD